ncbi:unnamed protein product, partial [Rotaria sp. Silwood2]
MATNEQMRFESLPNEMFTEIFKHLSISDLVRAFRGLNCRFDNLISKHFEINTNVDLRSAPKQEVDVYCLQFLPPITHRIKSLYLSNHFYTPNQIDQFFQHGFILRQFTRLKLLSLSFIHSSRIMDKILFDFPFLSNLTCLIFKQCIVRYNDQQAQSFVNIIWSLPNLKYCYFDISIGELKVSIVLPTVISSSIHHLSYFRTSNDLNQISPLLKSVPCLEYFSINLCGSTSSYFNATYVSSISKFKVSFINSNASTIVSILKMMPNLMDLTLDALMFHIDWDLWKEIIDNYLPKLKYFQWRTEIDFPSGECMLEKHVDDMLDSFRSDFWLIEHK